MDFETICKERFSVRSFSGKEVEKEKVNALLELARLAPTAKNNQPYEIYIYEGESLKKLKESSAEVYGSPLVFAVCADENKAWQNSFSGEFSTLQDIGIIATTLMYGATEYGLGSIYLCRFNPAKLKEVTEMPDNLEPKCLIAVGYENADCKPSPGHFDRREISEFTHKG